MSNLQEQAVKTNFFALPRPTETSLAALNSRIPQKQMILVKGSDCTFSISACFD
jgi:hypothetical protein